MNGYTTNNGVGISITSCFNTTFNRITTEFFTKGITLRSLQSFGGDSQGIFIDNLQMVECIEGVYAYGTTANYLSTLIVSNWMVDNGNINVPGHRAIILENTIDSIISVGQGLQNGGDSNIIFNNCSNCKILNSSLEFRANITGPDILFTGTTNGCEISNNIIGGSIQLTSGTSNNYGYQMFATIIDSGKNNFIGPQIGPRGLIGPSGASIVGPQGPAGKGFWSFL
jgi:hypothetical protein